MMILFTMLYIEALKECRIIITVYISTLLHFTLHKKYIV